MLEIQTRIETWPIKEYDAVRIWRQATTQQAFGRLYNKSSGARCAIGLLGGHYYIATEKFGIPDDDGEVARCPTCGKKRPIGVNMVTHWNDVHEYTFQQIADLAEAYPHLVFNDA